MSSNQRPLWILGNWKQNHLRTASHKTAAAISAALPELVRDLSVYVGVAPTFVALDVVRPLTAGVSSVATSPRLRLLAQDVAAQESGAFTGEVGPAMLRDAGVELAIIGHSERRQHFAETDATVAQKVLVAQRAGLGTVLCIGEALETRDAGAHESWVESQLRAALTPLAEAYPSGVLPAELTIAYEPIWAIGTGRNATPAQATAMHRHIRSVLGRAFGAAWADRSILYGGSVKPDNAAALLANGEVDGFLVGGASLDPDHFLAIVRAAVEYISP